MGFKILNEDDESFDVDSDFEDVEPEVNIPVQNHLRIKTNYVDPAKLEVDMGQWAALVKVAKAEGKPHPQIPRYTAECIILIANNMSHKFSYQNYSYLDEMIDDAIEDCCMYLHNYNPDAPTRTGKPNPFSYITRFVIQAFNNRITLEKRQDYYKNKSVEFLDQDLLDSEELTGLSGEEGDRAIAQMIGDMCDRARKYEQSEEARRQRDREKDKSKQKALEDKQPNLFKFMN